jgi:DNA invertase Pin-like site-specific DNA recombinase
MPLKATNELGPRSVPVAIYARVSTDNQVGGRFDSCESQTAICREYVHQRASQGWHEVASFTDAAYSGGNMNRPGIQNLKRMIEAGQVKVVVIFKLERMSRNLDEWGPFRTFLDKNGCRLVSATEDISEDEPEGRLKNNIMLSVADFERRNTAKKTRIKMREQAKRGFWNGGHVPYGYTYDKNTQTLQLHPEEAAVVRRIFEQAAQLVSLTDIANALNAEGLRTKERLLYRRDGSADTLGGRIFRSDGIRLILRNPLYRGAVRFGGQEYAAQHAALVTADLWDKANAANAVTKPRPIYLFQERDAHNHLLKGLAWCGSCGRALVPNDSGKKSQSGVKYRYYTCSLVMRESQTHPCQVRRLGADALEQAVIAVIGEASQHPSIVSQIVEMSRRLSVGDRDVLRTALEKIKTDLSSLDKKLINCADAVAQGGVEAMSEALVRRATELRQQRQLLLLEQEQRRQALIAIETTVLEETRIRRNLQRLRSVLPTLQPKEQKDLVRLFIDRVEVRRAAGRARQDVTESIGGNRTMEVRITLHLPELVRGMEERASDVKQAQHSALTIRGLTLDARVDFAHAQQGEVVVVAPFRQVLRIQDRVRTVQPVLPASVHPILRAVKWQQLLEAGTVANRSALARQVKLTPGAITRIMKLIELDPAIQAYLAALKSAAAIRHFGYRPMESLAAMRPHEQRAAFDRMRDEFEKLESRRLARAGLSGCANGEQTGRKSSAILGGLRAPK